MHAKIGKGQRTRRALAFALLASLAAQGAGPTIAAAAGGAKDPVITLPPAAGGEADGTETIPPGRARRGRPAGAGRAGCGPGRTLFEFSHQAARNNTCAVWDHYIRATSWIGGTNSQLRQPGALDRCEPRYLNGGFEGTTGFHRTRNEAVRWTRGASAFGVYLTTRSGFSENVTLEYTFGGSVRKRHYLCGPDGRSSPYEAGRVYSGAVR
jgi:hypothetical protein